MKNRKRDESTFADLKSKAVQISEKYSKNWRDRLSKMTKEEKQKICCRKCDEYFHTAAECKNSGRIGYKCFAYGHEKKRSIINPIILTYILL